MKKRQKGNTKRNKRWQKKPLPIKGFSSFKGYFKRINALSQNQRYSMVFIIFINNILSVCPLTFQLYDNSFSHCYELL